MQFSLRNAAAARVPGRITPMLAIPTPDFAVPYAAPTHENTNADAAPINPKNGATASPESSVDSADTRVASEASATAKSIVIEEEIPFFIWPQWCFVAKKNFSSSSSSSSSSSRTDRRLFSFRLLLFEKKETSSKSSSSPGGGGVFFVFFWSLLWKRTEKDTLKVWMMRLKSSQREKKRPSFFSSFFSKTLNIVEKKN